MSFLAAIHRETENQQLRFLVIGGLAVNHYGYARETGDFDMLVNRDDRARWLELFAGLGYAIHHDGGNFIQFSSPPESAWPVDLMLVREASFEPMFQAGKEVNLYGALVRVIALEHLLALKLHALKNARVHRFLKDFLDVENLIRINQLDIQSPNLRDLFLKYGTLDLHEKMSRSLAAE